MSRYSLSPDRLIDRPWRPGHPFSPRTGKFRRLAMGILLTTLCLIIGGYTYLTDSKRVRAMAESYLSNLVGGRVTVETATLSVFEGMRLGGVRVYVDRDGARPDSLLFSAQAFVVKYDVRSMVSGKLQAMQIVAEKPQVHLVHDLRTGLWNFNRLAANRPARPHPEPTPQPTNANPRMLPEVLLRNARVSLREINGPNLKPTGEMSIDGRFWPNGDGVHYNYVLQSSGLREGLSAIIAGDVDLRNGQFKGSLHNLRFDDDIMAMLPRDIQEFAVRHQISGSIDIPSLSYTPAQARAAPRFDITVDIHARMAVPATYWLSPAELAEWRQGHPDSPEPPPLRLDKVDGSFVFHDNRIDVVSLAGYVENNGFLIDGHFDGYQPDAAFGFHIKTIEPLSIPDSPSYVQSFPKSIQYWWRLIMPQGLCALQFNVHRNEGKAPTFDAVLDIIDGSFLFKDFPYPLRKTRGRIEFGRDSVSGLDRLAINHVVGQGAAGGPNANSRIQVDGVVAPLGGGGPEPGVTLHVIGEHIHSEKSLIDALPPDVRDGMGVFTYAKQGFPKFDVSFNSDIIKPVGSHQRWSFDTNVDVHSASGQVDGFPYPLNDVHGKLLVRSNHLEIVDAIMERGQTHLKVDGIVTWPTDAPATTRPTTQPGPGDATTADIAVTATKFPINSELIDALPPDARAWIERLGVGGQVDVSGSISVPPHKKTRGPTPVHFDLGIGLQEGTIWPSNGVFAVSQVQGKLHLTDQRLQIEQITGRRNQATLSGAGWLDLGDAHGLHITASATNLALEPALYSMLPEDARHAWDEVRPEGSVDASVEVNADLQNPAAKSRFSVTIKPQRMAVNIRSMPYRLTGIVGTVVCQDGHVNIHEITAHHGKAAIHVEGVGSTGDKPDWALKIRATDLALDKDLQAALPDTLQSMFKSLHLGGKVNLDLTRLDYRPGFVATTTQSSTRAIASQAPPSLNTRSGATQPAAAPGPDINLAGVITFVNASLDAGVTLERINGTVKVAAVVRGGQLSELAGDIDIPSMDMGPHQVARFSGRLRQALNSFTLQLSRVQAQLCGGQVAGDLSFSYPPKGKTGYSLNIALRDLDVKQLTGDKDVNGQLTGSLALEGGWDRPNDRRGRGDISVTGRDMYHVPLILGILQVTNLALPINSPFEDATARYDVDGQKVTFERLEMRSKNMVMTGDGSLDFGNKTVELSLATDNPYGFKIPFLDTLIKGAKDQILHIQVHGSIQRPQVQTSSLSTFTTTVDRVLNPDSTARTH